MLECSPIPRGYPPPMSPTIPQMIPHLSYITLRSPHFLQRQAEEEDTGRYTQYARARCTGRKGVGGIVHRMEDVGRCPEEDYITSLLLSTSMQGNLVEPQLCQRFPFLLLAPLHCQLHINWGFRLVSNRISLRPGECLAERTCSFSSPSCFSPPYSTHTHTHSTGGH